MLPSLFLASCLVAASPSSAAAKTQVDLLVLQLDGSTQPERKEAEQKLIAMGPRILDILPPPSIELNDDPRDALQRVHTALQLELARKSVEAATVTLQGNKKLSDVLAELQNQTGNAVSPQPQAAGVPPLDPIITVNFNKRPFWSALDDVLDQAQLSIYPYGQPGVLTLVPRGPNDLARSGRAAIVGPLRIEPTRIVATRDLRGTTPAALQIALEVAWEPRVQPIAVRQKMADLKAIDSTGAAVSLADPEAEKEAIPRPGTSAVEMESAFAMPSTGAKEIASLEGKFQLMLLGRPENFRFRNLKANATGSSRPSQRIADATVEITDVRKNGDAWEIDVRLSYGDAGDALESHRNWALQNKVYLEDAKGQRIESDSLETISREKNSLGVGYVFSQSPADMTFVYQTPGLITTKEFAFSVKGIKLP